MVPNSFQKLQKIGEGTYGVVYKAKDTQTGRIVALKKIRPDTENQGMPATTVREILLLKKLKHPSIIELIEIVNCDGCMYLVFEYVDYDLKALIENQKKITFSEDLQRKLSFQLTSAVSYIHSMGIFHRDLKPQNILVDKNFNVKLADFGLARVTAPPMRPYTPEIITLWYRPPELLLGDKFYDPRVDIWSLGCIISEICTLEPLFPGDSEIDQLQKIFSKLGTPTNKIWPKVEDLPNYKADFPKYRRSNLSFLIQNSELNDLINKMLIFNPKDRITGNEALQHEYFHEIKF